MIGWVRFKLTLSQSAAFGTVGLASVLVNRLSDYMTELSAQERVKCLHTKRYDVRSSQSTHSVG